MAKDEPSMILLLTSEIERYALVHGFLGESLRAATHPTHHIVSSVFGTLELWPSANRCVMCVQTLRFVQHWKQRNWRIVSARTPLVQHSSTESAISEAGTFCSIVSSKFFFCSRMVFDLLVFFVWLLYCTSSMHGLLQLVGSFLIRFSTENAHANDWDQ